MASSYVEWQNEISRIIFFMRICIIILLFFSASIFKVAGCCESKIIDFSKLVITHVCGLQSFGLHDYVCIVCILTKSTDNLNRT